MQFITTSLTLSATEMQSRKLRLVASDNGRPILNAARGVIGQTMNTSARREVMTQF